MVAARRADPARARSRARPPHGKVDAKADERAPRPVDLPLRAVARHPAVVARVVAAPVAGRGQVELGRRRAPAANAVEAARAVGRAPEAGAAAAARRPLLARAFGYRFGGIPLSNFLYPEARCVARDGWPVRWGSACC